MADRYPLVLYLNKESALKAQKLAHEKGITVDELIEQALKTYSSPQAIDQMVYPNGPITIE